MSDYEVCAIADDRRVLVRELPTQYWGSIR
jgi:hypothetical protein